MKVNLTAQAYPARRSYLFIWWLTALFFGVVVTRLIAPYQSPDENVHHWRAAMLANGQVLLEPSAHGVREGGLIDKHFEAYSHAAAQMRAGNPANDPDQWRHFQELGDRVHWAGREVPVVAAGTGYYTPVLYLPHAVAIWIAQQLDLSMTNTYELIRAVVIGSALAIVFYACSIWRPNVLMLMLVLTPISLFQWYSPTVDGLSNALLILLLALWLRVSRADSGARSLRDEVLIYAIVFIISTTRTHLLPTLLIPATLLVQRFSGRRLLALGALTLCVLGWQGFAASVSGQNFLKRQHSTSEIIWIYAANPMEFLRALGRTFESERQVDFYVKSFVGTLGWLDVPLKNSKVQVVYGFLAAGLGLTIWSGVPWLRRDLITRVSAVVMGVSSGLIAFLALAVSWNDYPTQEINGIQGRYMIPVAVILAFGAGSLELNRKYRKSELALLLVFVMYSVHETVKLLLRYYHLNPLDKWLS